MSSLLTSLLSTFKKGVKSSIVKSPVGVNHDSPAKKNGVVKVPTPVVENKAITKEAQESAREIIVFAREEAQKIRESAKAEMQTLQDTLREAGNKLSRQESELFKRENDLSFKTSELEKRLKEIEASRAEISEIQKKQLEKLEKIASLTKDKAKEILLDSVNKKITKDVAERIRAAEDEIKETVDAKSTEMLIDAMHHGATEYVAEFTISIVKIPDDEVKGRIIGKEGRNIRTFEKVTGVDIDMDETPGEVRLSCYDAVRREIARVALERLIKDGRIQPTRIEEYVDKARRDIDKIVFEEGKKLCQAVGAYNVPHELVAMLGRFKYRTSYGQNMIAHTLEETKIGISLASELNVNVDVVRLGCLFHDIGKLIDAEGGHIELGVKLLKKYNMPQTVVDCVAQHHEDEEFTSKESMLVYISDAISGARPGARYDNFDEYVKRLKDLEAIAMSKKGVSEAFAIQAGREVRVIVNPDGATDDEAIIMASEIRDEIKEKVTYPGTVTITVIRERRTTTIAK